MHVLLFLTSISPIPGASREEKQCPPLQQQIEIHASLSLELLAGAISGGISFPTHTSRANLHARVVEGRGLDRLYRGCKRPIDAVEDAEVQADRRMSWEAYKSLVVRLVGLIFSASLVSKQRHEFRHALCSPDTSKYGDVRLVIEVFPAPTGTVEVTLFRICEATRDLADQVGHAQLTAATWRRDLADLLQRVFG